jgi:alpha-soluble NSF attachment protein
MYRTVRELHKSGAAFERAADVQQKYMKDTFEAAKMLQDAFKSYRDVSPADAVRCLKQSIDLYSAKGNFRRAADLTVDMADIYETKLQDPDKALESLNTAITWYSDEGIQA